MVPTAPLCGIMTTPHNDVILALPSSQLRLRRQPTHDDRQFTGTPRYFDVGNYTINVTVKDPPQTSTFNVFTLVILGTLCLPCRM